MKDFRMATAMILPAVGSLLSGCAKDAPAVETRSMITTSPSLVLVDFNRDDSAAVNLCANYDVLAGRNDDRMGSRPGDRVTSVEFLEVRHREYLRTINGRPRDYSTTQTRTLKLGTVQ